MPHPRKYMPHGSVVFVTLSLEKGLLLTANPISELIVQSALARARLLYPVKICHFIVESSHIHIIFVVIGPDDAFHFVGHFKAEVAHRLNRVMGWRKQTLWCEGYDSPVVLTARRTLMAIAYLYANPAKDNLEDSIDRYPGLSSWRMFRTSGECKEYWPFIRRPAYRPLTRGMHSFAAYYREAARIRQHSEATIEFAIEPDAWLDVFGIVDPAERARWNEVLVARVRKLEERARRKRIAEHKEVIGAEALRTRLLTLNYQPKRRAGKRTWCLSDKRFLRKRFINFLKGLVMEARNVYLRWHTGDFSVLYPPGLFPPAMPKLLEPLVAL